MINSGPIKPKLVLHFLNVSPYSVRIASPNLPHYFVRHFSVAIALSEHAAPFRGHVLHVIAVRTEKQVIRSDAVADIAAVTHIHFVGDWAVVKHPRHAMYGNPSRFAPFLPDGDDTISVGIERAVPKPAPFSDGYMFPKAGSERRFSVHAIAFITTELARYTPDRQFAFEALKRSLTLRTFQSHEPCYTMISRHGMNLVDRFVSSLGPLAVQPAFGPLSF